LIIVSPFPVTKEAEELVNLFPIFWIDASKSCSMLSTQVVECLDYAVVQVLNTLLSPSTMSQLLLPQSIEYVIMSSLLNQWVDHPLTYITDPNVVEQKYDLHLLVDGDKQVIQSDILVFRAVSSDLIRFWVALYKEYSTARAGRKISSMLFQQKTIALQQMKFVDLLSSYIFEEGKYTQGKLAIQVLPTDSFPSAYEYFNKRSHFFRSGGVQQSLRDDGEDDGSGRPIVYMIVNAYLADEFATKHRLLRYGLWYYNLRDNQKKCTIDISNEWAQFFPLAQQLSSLSAHKEKVHMMRIDAPIHHTKYDSNDALQFLLSIESHLPIAEAQYKALHGLQQESRQNKGSIPMGNVGAGRKFYDYERMHTYIDSEAFYGFNYAATFLLSMNKSIPLGSGGMRYADYAPKIAHQSTGEFELVEERFGFSMLIPKTNMHASVDVAPISANAQLGEYYGIDFAGANSETAFTTAMKTHSKLFPSSLPHVNESFIRASGFEPFDPKKPISYTIKVLAFTRTKSLSRLLNSLVNAWYHNKNPLNLDSNNALFETINLEILVDGYRNAKVSEIKINKSNKFLNSLL
jgi:hypothetical protein